MSDPDPEVWDDLADDWPTAVPDQPDEAWADRVLRHLHLERSRRQHTEHVYEAEVDRIYERLRARLDIHDRQIAHLLQLLASYHASVLERDPRAKTVHLPSGTLRAKNQPPAWNWDDDDALLAWLRDRRPDAVRTIEKVDRAEAKRHLTVTPGDTGDTVPVLDPDTGEIVPGVTVRWRGTAYYADTEGGD